MSSETTLSGVSGEKYPDYCGMCKYNDEKSEYPCAACQWDGNNLKVPDMWVYEKPKVKERTPAIQDSGDRTQFQSGAVRDMHEGKGRCDLLPMCVLLRLARHYENGCKKYGDRNWEKGIPAHSFADSAMRHIFKYMDGQRDEDHLIAAIWNLAGLAWTEEKRPECMDIPARMEATDAQNKA